MKFNYEVEYELEQGNNNNVIIIRAAPGAGKSTLAKHLSSEIKHNSEVFEADQYFYQSGTYDFDPSKLYQAHANCQDRFRKFLSSNSTKKTAIVANTNIKAKEMEVYVDYALKNGFNLKVIMVKSQFKSIHNVPDEVVQRMRDNLQPFDINNYRK